MFIKPTDVVTDIDSQYNIDLGCKSASQYMYVNQ